jgi:hypothetical protein
LFFFQKDGVKIRIMGNISSLPRSIAKESRSFAGAEYAAKLAAGPTAPRPGPILLKHARVAVKFVSKSNGSNEMSVNITRNIIKYREKYAFTP